MSKFVNVKISSTPRNSPPKVEEVVYPRQKLTEDKFIVVRVDGKKIEVF